MERIKRVTLNKKVYPLPSKREIYLETEQSVIIDNTLEASLTNARSEVKKKEVV